MRFMLRALPLRAAALLLALVLALLLFRLGATPLVGPDEPRYARVAVEMQRAGTWVTPTLAGEPWLEKPPLYYWLAGACYSVLGETETAARLPSVLATLLLVGATALFGARLYGPGAGLHAGFVAGTALLPFAYGHAASMDMLLAATVTVAIGLVAQRLLAGSSALGLVAAAVAAALATLAKGPLGLLLPLLVVGGYLLATREWRAIRGLLSPAALAAFVIVAAPWYLAILRSQGWHFVDVFLLNHNVQRFTSTVHHHPGTFVYYVPLLLLGFFPWSGLLLPALVRVSPRASRTDLFLLLWAGLPFLFFSLAGSKLPGYILPCLPPLAILMGRAADHLVSEDATAQRALWGRIVALLGLALAAAFAALPSWLYFHEGEPLWQSTIPVALWAVIVTWLVSRRIGVDPAGALRLLRVGAAGLLLLVALVAPPILARRESGRAFFEAAMGREVLAWGAWRTAWMAGYFYDDAKVREVPSAAEIMTAAGQGPTLVLAGPSEARRLKAMDAFQVHPLVQGPRGNELLKIERR
jgi:4-amino-4-deoxy-L-arabinose transferase-like glycosyltransferase